MQDKAQKTQWFHDSKYGVMMHFLGSINESDESWNARVNAFDCEGLAKQLHDCGAGHLLFTISQTGGRFCCPIAAYDAVLQRAGMTEKLCSTRDLIADLIKALKPYGIKLMLYAAVEGPIQGKLRSIFPWDSKGGGPGEGFTERYFAMLRELSLRYGSDVWGWWIDGCYPHYRGYFDSTDTPFLRDISAVLRVGNPDAILAYNSGIEVKKLYVDQDYTCGEANELTLYPSERMIDGVQWHVLTYLGPWWSDRMSARSNLELIPYAKTCIERGGVLTFDVGYEPNGHIAAEHLDQLVTVRRYVRDGATADIPESEDYLKNMATVAMDEIHAEDYVNIALGKPCTASSSYSDTMPGDFFPQKAVDGDTGTGWAPGFVAKNGVWWQVDLGASEQIDAIEMLTRNGNNCERRNFEIRGSDDPEFSTYDVLYHQGEFPLPRHLHWVKKLDGKAYRYVRLQVNGRFCIPFISEMRILQKK